MAVVLDVLSWLSIGGGLFFMLVGTVGILRMPDVYTRLHAAGMTDTMGAGLLILGMFLHSVDGIMSGEEFVDLRAEVPVIVAGPVQKRGSRVRISLEGLVEQLVDPRKVLRRHAVPDASFGASRSPNR